MAHSLLKDEVKVEVKGKNSDKYPQEFEIGLRLGTMEGKDQLFTIMQVSERLKIPKHTLRFWERELNGLVIPLRTRGGQRRYTLQNLALLEEVKRCRESGLSLPEIIARINPGEEAGSLPPQKVNLLATRVAEAVKTEVYNFFRTEKEKA